MGALQHVKQRPTRIINYMQLSSKGQIEAFSDQGHLGAKPNSPTPSCNKLGASMASKVAPRKATAWKTTVPKHPLLLGWREGYQL